MVNLATEYMGLSLKNPLVPSASPLSRNLANIKRLEDAGAGAITLYSLFEEQIDREAVLLDAVIEGYKYHYAEMVDFYPDLGEYRRDEKEYLELIRKAKEAVDIPVIASLNGYSQGGWTGYARLFEEAGADAIELNIYYIPTSLRLTGAQVEALYLSVLREVKRQVSIPIAVKLSPYFTALPYVAAALVDSGADGLVLFNRFYQPSLDIEKLDVDRTLVLSEREEMRVPLRWVGMLYGKVDASLALTTGVHTAEDVIKALMAGADIVNVCSVLLKYGIDKLRELRNGVQVWLDSHDYESVDDARGILSHQEVEDPAAYERANYVKLVGQTAIGE